VSGSPGAGGAVVLLLTALLVLSPAILGGAVRGGAGRGAGGSGAPRPEVSASLPVWALQGGSRTVVEHADLLSSASPSLYEVTPDGGVALRSGLDPTAVRSALDRLHVGGVAVLPTVTNTRGGAWAPDVVQRVLHDPGLRDRHVVALVDLVLREGFAGVDVDYEELAGADRDAFSSFLARLGPALHAHGRLLAVDVFAAEDDAGYDERNRAQDLAAIGRSADQVRLMAYDWRWETSAAGPVAPVTWVGRVVAHAVTRVPRAKLVLGVPTYGYDWAGPVGKHPATVVSWAQAEALSASRGAPVRWSGSAQSPALRYVDDAGLEHELWFEDGRSTAAKLRLAREQGLGGVFLWLVGDVDPTAWSLLGAYRSGSAVDAGAQ